MNAWIVTERLELRALREADAPIIAAYRNDPQVAQYQSWKLPYTQEDAARLVTERGDRQPGNPGWVQIGLEVRETGELIGDVALNTQGQEAELGVTLSASAQGRGYASEGLRALIGFAFATLGLERVRAEIDPRNLAVERLLLLLGFRHTVTQYGGYLNRGEWTDNAVYTLVGEEWLT
ncbi:GNAT family N-acetyltransferase [Deinococcus sp.]|uniref:GNAT family N-acetyltransferase n=1 Tax=Deinococcus sp. TaxID=47478 RepID=UPI003C7CE74D